MCTYITNSQFLFSTRYFAIYIYMYWCSRKYINLFGLYVQRFIYLDRYRPSLLLLVADITQHLHLFVVNRARFIQSSNQAKSACCKVALMINTFECTTTYVHMYVHLFAVICACHKLFFQLSISNSNIFPRLVFQSHTQKTHNSKESQSSSCLR